MKLFFRAVLNRAIAVRALKLALPVVLAYICIAGVMGFEIWAVGDQGPEAVAGLGLGSWLFIVLLMAFHALEIGCQTIVARRFGEKAWTRIGAVLTNSLALSVGIGVPLTAILWWLAPHILQTPDPVVRDYALSYFRLRVFSLTPLLMILTLIGFYNGTGRPAIALYAYGSSTVLNVLGIYVLVLGGFGFQSLGVVGVAWASVISVVVGFVFMILPLINRAMRRRFALFRLRHLSWETLRSILVLSTPIFVQNLAVHVALFVFLLINAAIDTAALATTNIALTVLNFCYLPAVGFGVATATLTSQSLGARNPQRATISALICFVLSVLFMVPMGLLFIVGGETIMRFFVARSAELAGVTDASRAEVVRLGSIVLKIIGSVQIFEAMGLVFSKALQGAGRTQFVMWVEIIVYWVVFLPVAWFLGRYFRFGVIGAWCGYAIFLATYGLTMVLKFRRGDWQQVKL